MVMTILILFVSLCQVHDGVAYTVDQENDTSLMNTSCGALLHIVNLFVQRYETDEVVQDSAWQWVFNIL